MGQCLLHARTYARVISRLSPAPGIRFVLLDDEGRVTDAETGHQVETIDPSIVFGNGDVWFGPHARLFFKYVMTATQLDWFQSSAAGVDNAALQKVLEKAKVYTTNHRQAEAMAEWAVWQALDWLKRGPEHRANQKAAIWERLTQREMMGSDWLIIGYGAIGRAVAQRVKALGGHVTGVRRSGGHDDHADAIVTPDQIPARLSSADVVLLSLPHTPETEHIANAAFFSAMTPGSLFMNLGRGALVDEAALIAQLELGRPGHAALDVVSVEPLPVDSPLWQNPRITLTPHDSSETPGTLLRGDETFITNFNRYVANEPLLHALKA